MKSWIKSGLIWAVFMILATQFLSPYIMVWLGFDTVPEKQPLGKIIFFSIVFLIVGPFLAYRESKRKKQPRKQIDS
jgi:membrane protein DedA with SNARE-associated domain